MNNFCNAERSHFAKILMGLLCMAALLPLPVLAAGKLAPTLTVAPVQAGSIAVTHPTAVGTGYGAGKKYYVQLIAGELSASAMQNIGGWVTADSKGNINWPLRQDPMYGIPDAVLVAPSATLTATVKTNSGWKQIASTTFAVAPDPGTCTVSPSAARPGTTPFTLTGSGAQPNAALTAEWFDSTGCTCGFTGCYGCAWTPNSVALTADDSGNFSGTFAPASLNNGYCVHSLTIRDQMSGTIVATSSFNLCP